MMVTMIIMMMGGSDLGRSGPGRSGPGGSGPETHPVYIPVLPFQPQLQFKI